MYMFNIFQIWWGGLSLNQGGQPPPPLILFLLWSQAVWAVRPTLDNFGPNFKISLMIGTFSYAFWGEIRAADYTSSHQSLALIHRMSQSTQASGQRIHQRGQCLTFRKMSTTLHMPGQIGVQCHWLALHKRLPFKRDSHDKKCTHITASNSILV